MKEENQEVVENGTGKGLESGLNSGDSKGGETKGTGLGTEQGIGETGTETGTVREGSSGDKKGSSGNRTGAKESLLSNIRNRTNKGNSEPSNEINGNSKSELSGVSSETRGTIGKNDHSGGTLGGTNSESSGDVGKNGSHDGNVDNDVQSDETNRGRIKKGGVGVKPIDFSNLPSVKGKQKAIDQNIKWEEVLTKKESNDLKPRIEEALSVAFTYADKGIGATTRNPNAKNVFIWSSISKDEISVIALSLVETGQKSKAVATLTRRVARDFTKLQLGIILLPRFYMTVSHYMTNGFGLPFGGQSHE